MVIVVLLGLCVPVKNHGPLQFSAAHRQSTTQIGASRYGLERAYEQLPLSFEVFSDAEEGEAKAVARSRGFNLSLVGSDAIIAVGKGDPENMRVVQMRLLGGNPHPDTNGVGELGTRSNYLIGDHPNDWRIGIPNFERVLLHNVYPGIDLTYYSQQGNLEYDFVVAPGSDPRRIRLSFVGTEQLSLDSGNLLLHLGDGEIHLHEPVVYQVRDGKKVPVSGRFALAENNEVSFEIGSYDPRRAVVIDPGLVYSSYLGGSLLDEKNGIAVGKDGSAYVTGSTASFDFPVSTSGLQRAIGHSHSAVFVTKLNPSGSAIEYSTYLARRLATKRW